MTKPKKRFWRLEISYRGSEEVVFEIPTTHITEKGLLCLMKTLYAKLYLTEEEIVACHLRGNVRRHRDLLSVHEYRSKDPISFHIGEGSASVHAVVVRPGDSGWRELEDASIPNPIETDPPGESPPSPKKKKGKAKKKRGKKPK